MADPATRIQELERTLTAARWMVPFWAARGYVSQKMERALAADLAKIDAVLSEGEPVGSSNQK